MSDSVIVACISALASIVGGWFAFSAARAAKKTNITADEVNDAVNHRHQRGEGALKLYDLVWENHQKTDELIGWKRGYEAVGLLDNGGKVSKFVDETRKRLDKVESNVTEIQKDISD